jgi:hypothetical protein
VAGTTVIPLTTIQPGGHTYPSSGGVPIADSDVMATLTVDRTPAGGFNSLDPATTARLSIEQSSDGGNSWAEACETMLAGGLTTGHGGTLLLSNNVGFFLQAGAGRQLRAQVFIAGSAVAVSGSLVTA